MTVSLPAVLNKYTEAVQAELRDVLRDLDGPLYTMVRYHLGWVGQDGEPRRSDGGKGLRSTLCLLANAAVGGELKQALPAAAAVDLVHAFSLVHDDIQDHSPERHHRPTVWNLWGEAQAINAGDALFALARLALLRAADTGIAGEKVVRLSRALDETCLRLCEGQQADLAFEKANDLSVESYLAMIEGKTAALIALSCRLGASLAETRPSVVHHLTEGGRRMGLAYQARDDYLGIWGTASSLGKPVMEDVWERKKSLPVICAMQRASGADREHLLTVYRGSAALSGAEVERVVGLLEGLGAQDYCREVADEHAQAAVEEIEASGCKNDAAGQLSKLARFAAERDF